MKSMIVLTAFLALATAAKLPAQKFDSQNALVQDNGQQQYDYQGEFEKFQEHEECYSIANSFDNIVNVLRQYANYNNNDGLNAMKNELNVPDTFNTGNEADTFLTSVRVEGLKNFRTQNLTMSWGDDLVKADYSWPNLSIKGVYHFVNCVSRYSAPFQITLTEPKYSGETTMTKNANVYSMMSPASSVKFGQAIVNYVHLPEVFQYQQPQFDYFIKKVVCQHVATAVASHVYNDMTQKIRQTARPYLRYQKDKIMASDVAADSSFNGQFENGDRFELKNIRFDNNKNNLAKIAFVQANHTDGLYTAKLQLRLLNLIGESDFSMTSSDNMYHNGKIAFNFNDVKVVTYLNFNDKSVQTSVFVNGLQAEFKSHQGSDLSAMSHVVKQFKKQLVEYFSQKLGKSINDTVKNIM